jgi:FkbM family methyltransferase
LERNLRLNRLTNVLASNLALSDAVGRLILRSDPRNQSLDGHRFVEAMNQSAPVAAGDEVIACDTLDNYFSRIADGKPLSSVDLIIMDVEGAEWAVLKGANQTLRASPNVLLVLECSRNRHEVEKLLAQEGFRFYVWNPEVPCLDSADFVGAASKGTVVAYRGNPRAFFSRQ